MFQTLCWRGQADLALDRLPPEELANNHSEATILTLLGRWRAFQDIHIQGAARGITSSVDGVAVHRDVDEPQASP